MLKHSLVTRQLCLRLPVLCVRWAAVETSGTA